MDTRTVMIGVLGFCVLACAGLLFFEIRLLISLYRDRAFYRAQGKQR